MNIIHLHHDSNPSFSYTHTSTATFQFVPQPAVFRIYLDIIDGFYVATQSKEHSYRS